jgi:hypothetical protein
VEAWHLYIVLAVAVGATLLALGYVALCAFRLFRTVRRSTGHATAAAGPVVALVGTATERAQVLQGDAQRLAEDAARMQVSLKRVNILVDALREGLAPWRRLRAYVGK